jgi:uncharacterized coiled-coil protein SlyX
MMFSVGVDSTVSVTTVSGSACSSVTLSYSSAGAAVVGTTTFTSSQREEDVQRDGDTSVAVESSSSMSARFMQCQAVGKSMGITDPVVLARFVVDSVRLEEEREERRQERAVMERRYAEAERRSAEDRQLLREVLQAVTNLSTDVHLIQCQLNTLSREVGQFVRDQSKSCVDFDSASDEMKPAPDRHDENRCAGCDREVPREDCSSFPLVIAHMWLC